MIARCADAGAHTHSSLTNNESFGAEDYMNVWLMPGEPPLVKKSAKAITYCDVMALSGERPQILPPVRTLACACPDMRASVGLL